MGVSDFWSWNLIVVGVVFIVILFYLIVLIRKRRKAKFTHSNDKK